MTEHHAPPVQSCSTCEMEIRFVSDGRRIIADHLFGDLDHTATTVIGQELEVLVRRMRVFIMAAEVGDPAALLGATLKPLRAQCDTFYAELTTATSYAPGVEGRLTDSIAKMLAGDVTIPDDLSGLDES